jgi:regulator of sigma E protease
MKRLCTHLSAPVAVLIVGISIGCATLMTGVELRETGGAIVVSIDNPECDLVKGDVITKFNGADVVDAEDFCLKLLSVKPTAGAELAVLRDGEKLDVALPLKSEDDAKREIVVTSNSRVGKLTPNEAADEIWRQVKQTAILVMHLFKRKAAVESFVIQSRSIQSADRKPMNTASLLMFTCWLMINLSILNLLPIPCLAGGHAMFECYAILTGQRPSERVIEVANVFGLVIIVGLTLWVIFLDLSGASTSQLGNLSAARIEELRSSTSLLLGYGIKL